MTCLRDKGAAEKNDHMPVTHWEKKCLVITDDAVFSIDFDRFQCILYFPFSTLFYKYAITNNRDHSRIFVLVLEQ